MKVSLRELILALLLSATVLVEGITIRNRKLMDDEGRQIRFHGSNVVVKVPPYMPIIDHYDPNFSFSVEDMENYTKYGFNGMRLGMMWAGVEPTSQGYNETYLDEMQRLINMAGERGIYSLLDFHQDLIAEKFCGDGIPTWLIDEQKLYKTFPFPMEKTIKLNSSGLPSWNDCNADQWGKYYFSYDVGNTFNELYKSGTRLNTKFTEFWVKIATRFRGNKYVIGYELINEPFVGNAIRDIFLAIPSVAERFKFQDFYDRLAVQIKKVDPDTLIFFQPITFDQKIPTGFSHPPGGFVNKNTSVLAYHYYKPPGLNLKTVDGRIQDGIRLGIPSFLTQFGGGSSSDLLDKAQQNQQSWLYWHWKNFGKDWGSSQNYFSMKKTPVENYRDNGVSENLTMTYLQRIAGNLNSEKYDFVSKNYDANYLATPGGTSILFYSPDYNYKNGYELQVSPKEEMVFKEVSRGYIEIKFTGKTQRLVQITLRPL